MGPVVSGSYVGAAAVRDILAARVASGSRPGFREDGLRVALCIEGGVARGTVSGGMALAVHELGLTCAFDDIYGASAGAISGAWLTSGTPESLVGWADPAYGRMLIRRHGPLRRRPVLDVRRLVEVVYTQIAPMDFAAILAHPVRWHPLATDADSGESVDLRPLLTEPADVQRALHASACVPVLAGPPVVIGDRRYVDAGVAQAVPFHTAARQGATHILVLRSRRPDEPPTPSRAAALAARTALRGHGAGFRHALLTNSHRYAADDAMLTGRAPLPTDYPPLACVVAPTAPSMPGLAPTGEVLRAAFAAGRQAVYDALARS